MRRDLFLPLALGFDLLTRARNTLYDRGVFAIYRSRLPVVSVGNLSLGGNGKTPLCIFLAERLRQLGRRPVILSRGYGGTLQGPSQVRSTGDPSLFGDEPVLMAAESPVVIARQRVAGAQLIESSDLGDLIILDDGMQHRALARQVEILCVNISQESDLRDFCEGHLLPWGRFREARDRGLRRINHLVVNCRGAVDLMLKSRSLELIQAILPPGVKLHWSQLRLTAVRSFISAEMLAATNVIAISGVANPAGFRSLLESNGFVVDRHIARPDHHAWNVAEVREILAQAAGKPLVCTSKDGVKLRRLGVDHSQFYEAVVRPEIEGVDSFLLSVIERLQSSE